MVTIVCVQGVTQKFWEDDVLKELGKMWEHHCLANAKRIPNIAEVHGVLWVPWRVKGVKHRQMIALPILMYYLNLENG